MTRLIISATVTVINTLMTQVQDTTVCPLTLVLIMFNVFLNEFILLVFILLSDCHLNQNICMCASYTKLPLIQNYMTYYLRRPENHAGRRKSRLV